MFRHVRKLSYSDRLKAVGLWTLKKEEKEQVSWKWLRWSKEFRVLHCHLKETVIQGLGAIDANKRIDLAEVT